MRRRKSWKTYLKLQPPRSEWYTMQNPWWPSEQESCSADSYWIEQSRCYWKIVSLWSSLLNCRSWNSDKKSFVLENDFAQSTKGLFTFNRKWKILDILFNIVCFYYIFWFLCVFFLSVVLSFCYCFCYLLFSELIFYSFTTLVEINWSFFN